MTSIVRKICHTAAEMEHTASAVTSSDPEAM
jgi:hypothetical protein